MKLKIEQAHRFWKNVNITDSCWLWMAGKNAKGYGRFGLNYKKEYAHRVSYWLTKGEIPEELVLDHLCRNTSCVNPNHLEAVTPKENVLRGESIFAKQARQTHCSKDHIFDEINTYKTKEGKRRCKTCDMLQQRRFRQNHLNYHRKYAVKTILSK